MAKGKRVQEGTGPGSDGGGREVATVESPSTFQTFDSLYHVLPLPRARQHLNELYLRFHAG
jgi:hypothetical protein